MSDQDGRTRRRVLAAAAGVAAVGVLGRVVADQETVVTPSSASRSRAVARRTRPSGGPAVAWSRKYHSQAENPTPTEEAQVLVKSVVRTPDGGFALAGNQVYGKGTDDFVLLKTDDAGNREWLREYDGGGRDAAESLAPTDDGGYLVVGRRRREREETPTDNETPVGSQVERPWAVRTDADGAETWAVEPGENETGELTDCVQTGDGGFAVVGRVDDSPDGAAWFLKLDPAGDQLADERYNSEDDGGDETPAKDGNPSYKDRFTSVVEASDGDLLLGGAGNQGGRVVRTDASGTPRWEIHLEYPRATVGDVVETADGDVLVTGRLYEQDGENQHTSTDTRNPSDLFFTLLDAAGSERWTRAYNGGYNEAGRALVPTDDGGFAAVGTSHRKSDTQLFAVKTDGDGEERWSSRYPDEEPRADRGRDLVQTDDGGYAIAARDRFLKLEGGFTPTATATDSDTATEADSTGTDATDTGTETTTDAAAGDDCPI